MLRYVTLPEEGGGAVSALWSWSVTVIPLNTGANPTKQAIREQMDRIINSGPFHQSQRRQRFLSTSLTKRWLGAANG